MDSRRAYVIPALGALAATALALAAAYHCSLATDFDRELVIPDASNICENDEDCWGREDRDDCDVCDAGSHLCTPRGTDEDGDGWWVCERALERGTADCDDGDPDVFPGNPEELDLLDNDCDGIIDDSMLEAHPADPILLEKPAGGASHLWSRPSARYDGTKITAAWEADEDIDRYFIRVATLDDAGEYIEEPWYLIHDECKSAHNTISPFIAPTHVEACPWAVAYVDEHDAPMGVHTFDFTACDPHEEPCTEPPPPQQECLDAALPSWPQDPDEIEDLDISYEQAARPVLSSHPTRSTLVAAWRARPAGSSGDVVLLARFEHAGDWTFDEEAGLLVVSDEAGIHESGGPALVMAGTGYAAAWASSDRSSLLVLYMEDSSMDPADVEVVEVALPEGFGEIRDPVLLRCRERPGGTLVYLLFCSRAEGHAATEVWALSVELAELPGSGAFGAPLLVSESPDRASIEVAGAWYPGDVGRDVIGVAWSERRSGENQVLFRRIADLEGSRASSGRPASDEIALGLDSEGGIVPGRGPTVVIQGSEHGFAVLWWQSRIGSTDTGDLYMRFVRPGG